MAETAPARTRPPTARPTRAVRVRLPLPGPDPRPRTSEVFVAPDPVEPAEPWW